MPSPAVSSQSFREFALAHPELASDDAQHAKGGPLVDAGLEADAGRGSFEPRYVRLGGTWVRSPGKRGIALACAIPGSARK